MPGIIPTGLAATRTSRFRLFTSAKPQPVIAIECPKLLMNYALGH